MGDKKTDSERSGRHSLKSAAADISASRAMLWMEIAITAMLALSAGIGAWDPDYVFIFNLFFIVALGSVFIAGLGLFLANGMSTSRELALAFPAILMGCLLVSYSALVYETGNSGNAAFMTAAAVGATLAIAGSGILVVKVRSSVRLTGYYSLWLFGLLLMMFMPLHELGAVSYSSRDVLVGFFGFGITMVGAASFALEKRVSQRVETWITAGDAKYISGKFDEAVEYYGQALYVEPGNAKALANCGSAYLKMGMWSRAVKSFDAALEIDDKLAAAHSGRGLALTQLKRYSEALESHDRAIAADSTPVSWNNKGNTLVRMGAPLGEAVECYRKALELDSSYETAWFNRGKAELMNEDLEAAINSLTRAVELRPQFADAWFHKGKALSMQGTRDQEALYCFDTAIELNPTNADAWMERKILLTSMKDTKVRPIPLVNLPSSGVVFGPAARGQPLLETTGAGKPPETRLAADSASVRNGALRMATMGNYSSALAALDDRLAAAPGDVVTHMTRGILLSRIERFDEALASFEAAIRLKPEWVGPLFSRGMILAAKGQYGEALDAMEAVTGKRPNYTDAWSVKGIILGTQKRYAEAIAAFDRAIELDPGNTDAWRSKSTALNKLGRYEEALECYEKIAALSPAIEEARKFVQEERGKLEDAKTLFRQGVELAKSRLYAEGLALLKDAVELRPNYVDAIYIMGVINGVRGSYSEAVIHFERVLELRPDHVEALYGKGSSLLKLGDYSTALEILERVIKLNGQHVDAWCDRGVALTKLGKRVDAMECYDRALKIAGDHPQAIAQRERCVKVMKEAEGCSYMAITQRQPESDAMHNSISQQ